MPLIQASNELAVRMLNARGGAPIHGCRHIQGISMAGLSRKLTAIVWLIAAEFGGWGEASEGEGG